MKIGSSNKSAGVSKKFKKKVCWKGKLISALLIQSELHSLERFSSSPRQIVDYSPSWCESSSSGLPPLFWPQAWCWCLATVGPRWLERESGDASWINVEEWLTPQHPAAAIFESSQWCREPIPVCPVVCWAKFWADYWLLFSSSSTRHGCCWMVVNVWVSGRRETHGPRAPVGQQWPWSVHHQHPGLLLAPAWSCSLCLLHPKCPEKSLRFKNTTVSRK